ncbi:hypothetical protein BDQ12DRAFT_726739 [Crucibulum laeve]|uniref:DUF6533 domain-containing protein n=1 Tax=Crucibulum laeve TaxID=68775 RepID=A0A5C3LPL6_9AGAR|nr:hypothetical protein BDQ12DRAFT_726739 [Crucibulum laeve]
MVQHYTEYEKHPFWEDVSVRNYISLMTLVWLIWETIVMMGLEYKHIWKSERSIIRRLYYPIRYVALVGQFSNHVITTTLLSRVPLTPHTCKIWFAYQSVIVQLMISAVEAVVFLRVYVMYKDDLRSVIFLMMLFALDTGVMVYTGVRINLDLIFDHTCLIESTPKEVCIMGVVAVVVQLILWFMTMYKQATSKNKRQEGPLLQLMTRDGAIVCIGLSAFFGFAVPYTYFVHELTHSAFSILISLLSVIGCRVIMNIQKLKVPLQIESSVELTTWIRTEQGMSAFDIGSVFTFNRQYLD